MLEGRPFCIRRLVDLFENASSLFVNDRVGDWSAEI